MNDSTVLTTAIYALKEVEADLDDRVKGTVNMDIKLIRTGQASGVRIAIATLQTMHENPEVLLEELANRKASEEKTPS